MANYKDELVKANNLLAEKGYIFLGQNMKFGGTSQFHMVKHLPESQRWDFEVIDGIPVMGARSPLSERESGFDQIVSDSALVANEGPEGTILDTIVHKPTSDQISVYIVRRGDTISQIANMFDVDVNTVKWSNDLSSNVLREGQTLVILPVSGIKHKVVKGDTLDSIAKKYKGDKSEIVSYNGLYAGSPLSVGTTIIIPDGELVVAPVSSSKISAPASTKTSNLKDISGYYMRPISGGKKSQGLHGYNEQSPTSGD